MKILTKGLLLLATSVMALTSAYALEEQGGNDAQVSSPRLSEGSYPQIYSSSLHDEMSIKARYAEGGVFYLRGETNSFGEDEPINFRQEIIFCTGNDKTFTEVAKEALEGVQYADHNGAVVKDSASTGALPNQFISALENGLVNNASASTKGRFCYKVNNPDVDYRTSGSETATYCAQGSSTGLFEDPITRNRCELVVDIDLKAGETRYLRQPQGDFRTISQGFVRCADDGFGQPTLELVANEDNCGTNCNYSCVWADEQACSGSAMPRWGGGSCAGVGTTIFKGDVITISSNRALSFNALTGISYEGSADMTCQAVGESSVWVITQENCTEIED